MLPQKSNTILPMILSPAGWVVGVIFTLPSL
jgi:hypothetical protein